MIATTSTVKIQNGKAGEFETLVAAVTAKVRANEPLKLARSDFITPV